MTKLVFYDGAQQRLVAVRLLLDSAERALATDPSRAGDLARRACGRRRDRHQV
jgi:hypothetical protein